MDPIVRRGPRPTKIVWASFCVAMDAAGYTNKTLAAKMQVRPRTIGDWRRGTRVPFDSAIVLVAGILGCEPDDLRRDAPVKKFRDRYANCVLNTN